MQLEWQPKAIMIIDGCGLLKQVMSEVKVMEEAYEWETWSIFHDWSGAMQHVS
jgi:hypothetical protein